MGVKENLLEKAMIDKTKLTLVQRTITKNGTTFVHNYWVSPDAVKAGDKVIGGVKPPQKQPPADLSSNDFKLPAGTTPKEYVQSLVEKAGGGQAGRQKVMDMMTAAGIKFTPSKAGNFGNTWMQASMQLQKHLKKNQVETPVDNSDAGDTPFEDSPAATENMLVNAMVATDYGLDNILAVEHPPDAFISKYPDKTFTPDKKQLMTRLVDLMAARGINPTDVTGIDVQKKQVYATNVPWDERPDNWDEDTAHVKFTVMYKDTKGDHWCRVYVPVNDPALTGEPAPSTKGITPQDEKQLSANDNPEVAPVEMEFPAAKDKAEAKANIANLLMEHTRAELMATAEASGVQWSHSEYPGTNWMRCSMAIQRAMRNGGFKYSLGDEVHQSPDAVTEPLFQLGDTFLTKSGKTMLIKDISTDKSGQVHYWVKENDLGVLYDYNEEYLSQLEQQQTDIKAYLDEQENQKQQAQEAADSASDEKVENEKLYGYAATLPDNILSKKVIAYLTKKVHSKGEVVTLASWIRNKMETEGVIPQVSYSFEAKNGKNGGPATQVAHYSLWNSETHHGYAINGTDYKFALWLHNNIAMVPANDGGLKLSTDDTYKQVTFAQMATASGAEDMVNKLMKKFTRKDIIKAAKAAGVTWEEHPKLQYNWPRAKKAIIVYFSGTK